MGGISHSVEKGNPAPVVSLEYTNKYHIQNVASLDNLHGVYMETR